MKIKTLKEAIARIKYLETLIASGDTRELEQEARRLKGLPIPIEKESDIRL